MQQSRPTRMIVPIGILAAGLLVGFSFAQSGDSGQGDAQADQPADANAPAQAGAGESDAAATQPSGEEASSEQVMQQLLKQREPQAVEPSDAEASNNDNNQPTEQVEMPAAGVKADQSVLGVAPSSGEDQPDLLREGEFIVNRRGHLARAKDSNRLLFVFDSDKKSTPEAPMVLQACRTLETMEKIVEKRGESVSFIISGQVHAYRNQNYLMPTMMKIAQRDDNLQ